MAVKEDVNIISSERDSLWLYLSKAWKYRNLVITFAKRDLRIKYAQTFFGIFWILLQPLPSIIIFTFFFGKLIKVDTGKLPYPLFALSGLIGWTYLTNLTSSIGNSFIESQQILKKIYFPKIILPLSKVLVGATDFLVAFTLIILAMLFYSVSPKWTILFFPFFFLFNIVTGFAIGIWISSFTFRYRDLQHFAPYIINFCIWLTPVFYPTTILPSAYSSFMYLNPMAFVIEGYRFTLVGEKAPSPYFLLSVVPVLFLFVLGLWYYRKIEDQIADYI